MWQSGTWMVDHYHSVRSRLLKDPESVIRSHVRKRCEDGSPIGREEREGPLACLNSYEYFVLLPLLDTELLIEAADDCAKNCEPSRRYISVPLTYDEAMVMELGPLLAERLLHITALANSLAQTCLDLSKPKPKSKPLLPFKATRVRVAHNRLPEVTSTLKEWEAWALELGCREPFWYSDFEFEVMATSPQQHNLAYYAAESQDGVTYYPPQPTHFPTIIDEGEVDPEETLLEATQWQRPLATTGHGLSGSYAFGFRLCLLLGDADTAPKDAVDLFFLYYYRIWGDSGITS